MADLTLLHQPKNASTWSRNRRHILAQQKSSVPSHSGVCRTFCSFARVPGSFIFLPAALVLVALRK
eukprot:scaffold6506_cov171-Amphora_coffeaeformis.AAC.18